MDIDAAIIAYLGTIYGGRDAYLWDRLIHPVTAEDRRAARLLWDDARTGKEILSRAASTMIHVPLFGDDALLTRGQVEQLARPILERTVRTTRAVLREAGVDVGEVAGLFLVGGSSRIPLAATMLHQTLRLAPTVLERPELVVAEGSLHAQPTDAATLATVQVGTTAPTQTGDAEIGIDAPDQQAGGLPAVGGGDIDGIEQSALDGSGQTPGGRVAAPVGTREELARQRRGTRLSTARRALVVLAIVAAVAAGIALLPRRSHAPSGPSSTGVADPSATLVIGVDLPLQGASKDTSESTISAMRLYLEQQGGKAGKYQVGLKVYDNSTAAKGTWDDAQCASNAQAHVSTTNEVAVMGTYNSGCAKIEVPTLNQAPDGPLLMVSHANTNPGLTKAWDPGEPAKFYPTGKRNYARVITTDDYQGTASAEFVAKDLKLKKCFVLNDNTTYGLGVANAFADEANRQGIDVPGKVAWDAKQPNYTALFASIRATNPDCVYIGGIFDNNGGQLVKDKVKILGPNTGAVKLIAPDGFSGYPEFQKLPEGEGTYLTFAGLDTSQLKAAGGAAATFLNAYKAKYGADPSTSYAVYGVAALQVILAAIEKSDGTRKGVRDAVFEAGGITLPPNKAMLGNEIKIDPASGDVSVRDISVLQMKAGQETLVKTWTV